MMTYIDAFLQHLEHKSVYLHLGKKYCQQIFAGGNRIHVS
jgi:hypothetical protein